MSGYKFAGYLRLDVNKYANTTEGVIDELPIIE